MGLTVHYKFKAPAGTNAAQAKRLVMSTHRIASRFQREGCLDDVGPVSAEAGLLSRFATDYLPLPVPGEPNTCTGVEVAPLEGWMFLVRVGRDCEPLRVGLCRYPATVTFRGRELRTKLGDDWRFWGFTKTQYASLHGWEHFLRCHRAVIDLLAALRPLGVRVSISDEGEYWPRRSITALRNNVENMNALVAGMAGALKDAGDGNGIESPIFAHTDFERLEAEGQAQRGEAIQRASGEISKLLRKSEG